eukprot:m.102032 g.102032  ORF g.102032 m.102032 type:complete len:418 (-) comp15676_c0_seq1:288-1541(-)
MQQLQRGPALLVLAVAVAACVLGLCQPAAAYNNGLGRLPPMGWNTWCTEDLCGARDVCTEELIMSTADGIVAQGLDKLGYTYLNMDDCWSANTRNATGHLQPNAKQFPRGLRPVADYLHARGLKFGLYTCVGTETCRGGRPGSFDNWDLDAATFAEWGMDFIKADNCHRPGNYTEQELYGLFSKALNATGRPMLFSLCEWGDADVQTWGADVGQMYRIQQDHLPFWHFPPKAAGAGFGQGTGDIIEYVATLKPSTFVKPFGWMDPDFLETLFRPTMSFIDSRTEFTFWALWSAPLIVATDLRNLTSEKLSIVGNAEVIAIDQDELGTAGDRFLNTTDGQQVWAKPLANGDLAVVLYNSHNLASHAVTFDFTLVGWQASDKAALRDLWQRKDLGVFTGKYTSPALAPHDVQMLRMSRA